MEALMLARMQFAANVSFHILFPSITIALGWILLFFKVRWTQTQDSKWQLAYQFWVKVFSLSFAVGVVSGIIMSFQFGTNWPGFMLAVGNVAGPLLGYEVLSAFFLEATFLGIMLFGQSRVSNRIHTLATFLVAFGTTLSAYWILTLNSWMHTPTGFEMIDGKAVVTSWAAILTNPSVPYRMVHMLIASGLTAAFLLAGISAYRWLRHDGCPSVMATLRTGITLGAVLIPLQILSGDLHGLNTLQHQPAKIAAMEGLWNTREGADLLLFAIPREDMRENLFEIKIPRLASLILTHDWNGRVQGLNDFPGNHPPVAPLFYAFRIMVGIGFAMLGLSWLASWQLWRRQQISRLSAKALVGMTFSGWVAVLAGWYTTEIGRQPWLVQGILRTDAAAAPIPSASLGVSLAMYLVTYAVLLVAFVAVLLMMARRAKTPLVSPPSHHHKNVHSRQSQQPAIA